MSQRLDERGTVFAETLVAFWPLLLIFLGIWQWGLITIAQLAVADAAVRGARALAITLDDDPCAYDGEKRKGRLGRVDKSARIGRVRRAMKPALEGIVGTRLGQAELTFLEGVGGGRELDLAREQVADEAILTVRVEQRFRCGVPLVRSLMCEASKEKDKDGQPKQHFVKLSVEAAFPNQGAPYLYPSEHGKGCERGKP